MKTIKQFDGVHPQKQLKSFFTQIHLGQILITSLVLGWSCIRYLGTFYFNHNAQSIDAQQQSPTLQQTYGMIAFLTIVSLSDFWLFLLGSLSDFKRKQESLGSLCLCVSFLIRSNLVLLVQYFVKILVAQSYPTLGGYFYASSLPLQFLLMISVSEAISHPREISYIFIKPFQTKTLFKPLFYIILAEVFALRVDLVIPLLLELLLKLIRFDSILVFLAQSLQRRSTTVKKLQKYGYRNAPVRKVKFRQIDLIKTQNSIIIEQK